MTFKDLNSQELVAELTIFGEGPDNIPNAKIVDKFTTPSSESYLLDTGEFSDGERMYIMAERFESTGGQWSNSFPEMDRWQLADYLEGNAAMPNYFNWPDHAAYADGLRSLAEILKHHKVTS